jgi:peptide/nickel transport system permease protein
MSAITRGALATSAGPGRDFLADARQLGRGLLSGGLGIWVAFLLVVLIFAVFGDRVAPYDPTAQDPINARLEPFETSPRGRHLLGTDTLGRDVFSTVIAGTRLTIVIATVSMAAGAIVGVTLGMLGGYYGGRVDRFVMRLAEAQTAMPMFLVAIFFLSVLGPSVLNVMLILPTLVWPVYARIVRAETLRLRHSLFIEAAVATGCTDWTILRSHVLTNVAPRIVALSVIEIGYVMLAEAGLSFLGVGVQSPDTTWGLLIARGRPYLAVAWWLAIMPGLFLGLTVLSLNMLSRRFATEAGTAA